MAEPAETHFAAGPSEVAPPWRDKRFTGGRPRVFRLTRRALQALPSELDLSDIEWSRPLHRKWWGGSASPPKLVNRSAF